MQGILDRFRKKKNEQSKPAETVNRIFDLNEGNIHDHYIIKHLLGKGSFSTVKLGVSIKDGTQVAVKIIDKNSIDVKVASLKTEVKILMNVKHPNIVSLLDVFEDNEKVYLIMELMTGGELFDRICNDFPNGYSEKQSSILIKKTLQAVEYFHEKGIIHRDLKPENLLFSSPDKDDAEIKISDFGLAKIWSGDMLVKTACGPGILPDFLENKGVILYVLLCGFCPFFDECTPALFASITSGNYTFPSPYWDTISEDAKDLVRNLLVVDPRKRFTPEQALKHRWILSNTREEPIPDIVENMKKFKDQRSQASFDL